MATTRWYLPSTGAAAVNPANDSWTRTAGMGSDLAAVRTRISSSMATVTSTKTSANPGSALIRQYVTEPLAAQTITGNVSGQMRCIESNGALSACVAVSVRAVSNDGTTVRSGGLAISASDLYTTTSEMYTSLRNLKLMDVNESASIALTSMTLSDGDRLVFEFGYKATSTSTTYTGGISFGDNSATDLAADMTTTTANNPWIEFDSDIKPQYIGTVTSNFIESSVPASPITFTHDATGADLLVVCISTTYTVPATITSVTFNGVGLTQQVTVADTTSSSYAYCRTDIWTLAAPAQGSYTLSIAYSGTGGWGLDATAVNVIGAVTIDSTASHAFMYGDAGNRSVAVTSKAGDLCIVVGTAAYENTFYELAGQDRVVLHQYPTATYMDHVVSLKYATTTSTTLGWSTTSGSNYGCPVAAISLTPPHSATVALTRVSGTGSVGTVIGALALALTQVSGAGSVGNVTWGRGLTQVAATSSVGTVRPSITRALTGVSADGSVGSVEASLPNPDITLALTGVSADGSVGTIEPQLEFSLPGNVGVGSLGSVTPGISRDITANGATGSVGTVTPQVDATVALSGNSGTGSVGTVTPSSSIALSQVSATGSVGTVTADETETQALTGVSATSSVGTVTPSSSVSISQVEGTGSVGTVTGLSVLTKALTQVTGSGSVTSVSPNITVVLTGVSATGTINTIGYGTNFSIAGQAWGSSSFGSSSFGGGGRSKPNTIVALTGVSGTGSVGSVDYTVSETLPLTGVSGIGSVGSVGYTVSETLPLTQVSAIGSVGTVIASGGDTILALTGVSAAGSVGDITPNISFYVPFSIRFTNYSSKNTKTYRYKKKT